MLRLNVFVSVDEQNRAAYSELAKELVAASLNDEGCIAYDLFESATRPGIFMICETWSSEECLTKHSNAEHFTRLVPQMEKLAAMKVEKFEF